MASIILSKSQSSVTRILGPSWSCESTRETQWEKEELDEAIRSKTEITGLRKIFGPEKPPSAESESTKERESLDYTQINLKHTWPLNAVGRERTVWARDRSWVLTDIFRRLSPEYGGRQSESSLATADSTAESLSGNLPSSKDTEDGQSALLAELSISFVLTVLLANYSSAVQFKHILEISLTAGEVIKSHTKYFVRLVGLVEEMLKAARLVVGGKAESDDEDDEEAVGIPVEDNVLEEFVSGGDAWLIKLLRGFNRELKDVEEVRDKKELERLKEAFEKLEKVCRRVGWYLDDQYVRKGMVDLPPEEGGGRIEVELEDMEGEDERGEFAPVIVEL